MVTEQAYILTFSNINQQFILGFLLIFEISGFYHKEVTQINDIKGKTCLKIYAL